MDAFALQIYEVNNDGADGVVASIDVGARRRCSNILNGLDHFLCGMWRWAAIKSTRKLRLGTPVPCKTPRQSNLAENQPGLKPQDIQYIVTSSHQRLVPWNTDSYKHSFHIPGWSDQKILIMAVRQYREFKQSRNRSGRRSEPLNLLPRFPLRSDRPFVLNQVFPPGCYLYGALHLEHTTNDTD